jgi:diadenosine tetraphosphatase ApaH/serine/threonine PP2A family protein phosphatase
MSPMNAGLVQPLFDGPIDIVGDIHGEIQAIQDLLGYLGYRDDGKHPEGRRLVFTGDLTDRGPDSPAVVRFVSQLVGQQLAQCVLGNHELNILLGQIKHDNHWFYGQPWALDGSDTPTPAVLADEQMRQEFLEFFSSLPLALQRDGIRVVHAYWDSAMIEIARHIDETLKLHDIYQQVISARHERSSLDEIERELEHQNLNPVKLITSGPERRMDEPFHSSGKLRNQGRVYWWREYDEPTLCVFGHYNFSRDLAGKHGQAVCVDFGVSSRWKERKRKRFDGSYQGTLSALRIPERVLVFDDGVTIPLDK